MLPTNEGAVMAERAGDKISDKELVAAFKKGDLASFEEIVHRYTAKAFSLATRLTKNQPDAEEVLQDVFVTVYRKIHSFEGKSSFSSWLYRITVNAAFMKLRKRKGESQNISMEDVLPEILGSALANSNDDSQGDKTTARSELARALEDAINKLPDEYRPVFILRDVDGLTSGEVSKILDLTIPAVKSRLHRSRLMLRRRLSKMHREFSEAKPGKVANS